MKYEETLLEALEQFNATKWYGTIVCSFKRGEDSNTYRRMYQALSLISGVEVSDPDKEPENEDGMTYITVTPQTAHASAICHIIIDSFGK